MKLICRKGPGYNEFRHFISHEMDIHERWDLAALIEKIAFRLIRIGYMPTWKSFFFRPLDPATLIGFNTIRIDGGPFVVLFETTLPRISKNRLLLSFLQNRALSGNNCLGMIAISECARDLQLLTHGGNAKLSVLHPPQRVLANNEEDSRWNNLDRVRFCFVGRDFGRKGGVEILRAFDALDAEDWHLTIVSSLSVDDYATQYTKQEQQSISQEISTILNKRKNQITWHASQPNKHVLEVMRTSHVGLLPTWHDTYGYSVLEFQASGCPVITTDVRALPEINNNTCGWIIPIGEKFGARISPLKSDVQRQAFSLELARNLQEIFNEILGSPRNLLRLKSQACIARIQAQHDPTSHKLALQKILKG